MDLDKIDRLAAEKVMGWVYSNGHAGDESMECWPYWQPTRNIAQAWECLEKFVPKHDFSVEFQSNYGVDDATGWSVAIDGVSTVQFAETAPLAIVLACLRAKNIEVE